MDASLTQENPFCQRVVDLSLVHCWSIVDPSLIHRRFIVNLAGQGPPLIYSWSILDPLSIHRWSIVDPFLILCVFTLLKHSSKTIASIEGLQTRAPKSDGCTTTRSMADHVSQFYSYPCSTVIFLDADCFNHHSWWNNVIITIGTLSPFLM